MNLIQMRSQRSGRQGDEARGTFKISSGPGTGGPAGGLSLDDCPALMAAAGSRYDKRDGSPFVT